MRKNFCQIIRILFASFTCQLLLSFKIFPLKPMQDFSQQLKDLLHKAFYLQHNNLTRDFSLIRSGITHGKQVFPAQLHRSEPLQKQELLQKKISISSACSVQSMIKDLLQAENLDRLYFYFCCRRYPRRATQSLQPASAPSPPIITFLSDSY